MNDKPNAPELLEIARRTLVDGVLPQLPEALRYNALMIANAMAIAARESAEGDYVPLAELARLRALFDEGDDTAVGAVTVALTRYNQRLAAAIREGQFDGQGRTELNGHLRTTTTDKLKVANPKVLKERA